MPQSRFLTLFFLFSTTLMLAVAMPWADAFASATTVGTQAKQIAGQVAVMPRFIAVICYVIGVFFSVRGLLALKGFIEKSDDTPITKPLALASVGALLIALPYIVDLMVHSLNMQTSTITSTSQSFSDEG